MKNFNNFNAFAMTNVQVQEVNGGWCSGGSSYGGRSYSNSYSYNSSSCGSGCYGSCGGCNYQQEEVKVVEQPRTYQTSSYSCGDISASLSSCFSFCGGW